MLLEKMLRQGNSKDYSLRRLQRERRDLHQDVLAGRISAHRAMVKAGLRKASLSVPLDAEGFAKAIQRHLGADQLRTLGQVLHELLSVEKRESLMQGLAAGENTRSEMER